ncbi:hypothetical protein [Actinomadura hibisca]|uniref:hypothetical protein n=1 Tax=Actinomadura hibisca TaxID=68565 RepID=UPI0008345F82|nr:hypothetical protein [Actinomadura hibisca]
MSVEDDFGLWERELRGPAPEEERGGGMVVVAAGTAAGCVLLIVLGDVRLGVAGLTLAALILFLWRIGL